MSKISFHLITTPPPTPSARMIGVAVWLDNTEIGWGWLTIWRDVAEISDLFIAPTHRNRGIGTALIRHLVGIAKNHACQIAEIGVGENNPSARRLYERLGFMTHRVIPATPQPIYYLRCPIDRLLNP
ncbi:MAG: GNAT family N-acetyltransferase [Phototrophicales bacterium]|nr:GNAT family N-acetyltransferase [Phototrophicales bacterium]